MHPVLCPWPGGGLLSSYAAFVAAGYALGAAWLRGQRERIPLPPRLFWPLIAVLVFGALLGGKLGFFVVEWREFCNDPVEILRDLNSGWVFWAGFLCSVAAGVGFLAWQSRRRRQRIPPLPIGDYIVAALAMGHALGRLGCFLDGCCHGRPTRLPWGVTFTSLAASVEPALLGVPLHPTQLYESGGEAVAAWLLVFRVLPAIRAGKLPAGSGFLGYVVYYSALRFVVELFRGDPRGSLLSPALSPSQWVSLAAGSTATWLLAARLRRMY